MNTIPASRFLIRRSLFNHARLPPPRQLLQRSCIQRNVRQMSDRAERATKVNPKESEPSFNPYDDIGNYRRDEIRIAKTKREMRYLFAGLLMTIGASALMVFMYPIEDHPNWQKKGTHSADAKQSDNEDFQGKPVIVAAGGQKLVAEDPTTHAQIELVPTGTSYVPHFPRTISLPSGGANEKDSEYTLIGLGIRRVSFLSVQVYVVGFYVKTTALNSLQSSMIHRINPIASALIPGEKEQLKASLLDAEESEQIWTSILQDKDAGIETAFRVVPVRDTNFNHLRDGWVTGINAKMQEASKRRAKAIKDAEAQSQSAIVPSSEFEDDTMGQAVRSFKQLFQGKGKAPKGSIILLTRDASGKLDALYQKDPAGGVLEHVGDVQDERISRLIWLLYLGGKNVSSEEARKDVVAGVSQIVERPKGTVETQIV